MNANSTIALDDNYHQEFRTTYLGAVPHTITYGSYWILGGLATEFFSITAAILIFLALTSFGFPIGELVRKYIFGSKSKVSPANKLPQLLMLVAFTVPLSLPVVYMAIQSNINWFFSATAIIVGAHYLPFYYGYKMPTFLILGAILIALGVVCAFFIPDSFAAPAYLTGGILMVFAIVNYSIIKKETIVRPEAD